MEPSQGVGTLLPNSRGNGSNGLTGDRAGFTQYVTIRQPAWTRTAYLLTGDHHLAEDLTATALLAAARQWSKIHTDPDPYVRRCLVNARISAWRKHKGREVPLGETKRSSGSDHAAHTESKVALRAALATLTGKQRAVLVLRYYEDLTEAQTADALGVSVGTVKSTARQALARLRERAPHLADLIGST